MTSDDVSGASAAEPGEAPPAPEWPDLPMLDERAVGRAVRSALIRTVVTVLAVLVALRIGWSLTKVGVDAALDRPSVNEGLTILQLGHPELTVTQDSMSSDRVVASLSPLTATGRGGSLASVTVTRSIFGTLHFEGGTNEQSPLLDALASLGQAPIPPKARQLAALRKLPAGVTVQLLVSFKQPIAPEEVFTELGPTTLAERLLFSDAGSSTPGTDPLTRLPVAWGPNFSYGDEHDASNGGIYLDELRQLRDFVARHRKATDHQWQFQGVDMSRVRAAAAQGLVHGVVVSNISPSAAISLLGRPTISQVIVTDVALVPPTP